MTWRTLVSGNHYVAVDQNGVTTFGETSEEAAYMLGKANQYIDDTNARRVYARLRSFIKEIELVYGNDVVTDMLMSFISDNKDYLNPDFKENGPKNSDDSYLGEFDCM